MILKAGGKSSKTPPWNMLRRVYLETPSPPWPVKLKAARAGPRSDASLHDAETVSQRHDRGDGRPDVVQDQNHGLAEVIRKWFKDDAACPAAELERAAPRAKRQPARCPPGRSARRGRGGGAR